MLERVYVCYALREDVREIVRENDREIIVRSLFGDIKN